MDTRDVTRTVDRLVERWGPRLLVVTAGLLWLSNVSWKVPPNFGALSGFLSAGVDNPVVPGSSWVFENVIVPNAEIVGWITLLVEGGLAATLLAGRFLRTAAVVGVAQSIGIGMAVANADHEWFWAYLLMIALHLAVLVVAPNLRPVSVRAGAIATAVYGAIVAVAHAQAGLTGDGDPTWTLFTLNRDIPDEFGHNTFPGSILLGVLIIGLALIAWLVGTRAPTVRRPAGWVLVGVGLVLLLTYNADGLIIGLQSGSPTAVVIAALGLVLTGARDPSPPPPSA